LSLFDAAGGFRRDVLGTPLHGHDMQHVSELHPMLAPGAIVMGDRALCSYAHLALLSQGGLHGVFRIHQKQIVDFRPHRPTAEQAGKGHPSSRWVQRLGYHDQLVEWRKPASPPEWMDPEQYAQLPEHLLVREIRWRIRESKCRVREITLVTTLLDPLRYPTEEVAGLFRRRWRVEVCLKDLKITLGMDVLKGQSVDVVRKEALVFSLVYNLVRLVMLKAAGRQKVHPFRISFIDALRWLTPTKPSRLGLPELVINPERPGRWEPRCIKRRMKEYDLMREPRDELRKKLKKRRKAA
jgi:hypothetical protein